MSIDEIVLRGVEVVSGDRALRGDIELVPHGGGAQIRRMVLAADTTAIRATGDLTSAGADDGHHGSRRRVARHRSPGRVRERFHGGIGDAAGIRVPRRRDVSASPVGRLTVGLKVGRATTGTLVLSDFTATAVVTPDAVPFDPLALGVFGGRYEGSMQLALGAVPRSSGAPRWPASTRRR